MWPKLSPENHDQISHDQDVSLAGTRHGYHFAIEVCALKLGRTLDCQRFVRRDERLWLRRHGRPSTPRYHFTKRLKKLSSFHFGRAGSLATRCNKPAITRLNFAAAA